MYSLLHNPHPFCCQPNPPTFASAVVSFFLFHIASQQRCIVLPVRKHVATVSIAFSCCDLRFGIIFSDCFLTDQMRISVPEFKKIGVAATPAKAGILQTDSYCRHVPD